LVTRIAFHGIFVAQQSIHRFIDNAALGLLAIFSYYMQSPSNTNPVHTLSKTDAITVSLQNAGKRFNREWIFRNVHYTFQSGNSYANYRAKWQR
jgi:hypothetical protein